MESKNEHFSIKITYFFLALTGFGVARNNKERMLLNILYYLVVSLCIYSCYISAADCYYCFKKGLSFEKITYALLTSTSAAFATIKFSSFALQHSHYEKILKITREKLFLDYSSEYEERDLNNCHRQATVFLVLYVGITHITGISFTVEPILLNIMSNSTDPNDRHLPYRLWIDIPVYETPYYEFFFTLDAAATYFISIIYFCSDYYLVLCNVHITGRFKILRRRFEELLLEKKMSHLIWKSSQSRESHQKGITMEIILEEFEKCVKQHQFLTWLVNEIEDVYRIINLIQILVYSLLICIVGYESISPGDILLRIKFGSYLSGSVTQLYCFTLSCHNVMTSSADVADEIYHSKWYKKGRSEKLAKNFMIVIMRTQRSCHLTGGGFFPITLDTFKSILTTAFSYLTLMRKTDIS